MTVLSVLLPNVLSLKKAWEAYGLGEGAMYWAVTWTQVTHLYCAENSTQSRETLGSGKGWVPMAPYACWQRCIGRHVRELEPRVRSTSMNVRLLCSPSLGRPSAPWTGQIIVTEEEPTGKNSGRSRGRDWCFGVQFSFACKYIWLFVKLWKERVAEITYQRIVCGGGGTGDWAQGLVQAKNTLYPLSYSHISFKKTYYDAVVIWWTVHVLMYNLLSFMCMHMWYHCCDQSSKHVHHF